MLQISNPQTNRFIFLVACCISALLFSCKDSHESPIPSYYQVYLDIDFQTPRDKDLKGIPSYQIYTEANIVKGKEMIGFGGILVVHALNGEYKAFDLACPKESNSSVRVHIEDDYNAVCPVCGSRFEVILNSSSGMCISGPAKYPLRYYQVIGYGSNKLIVRN